MLNIIFDENSGSFFFTCKEEDNMTLEEELIIIAQKIFALYAANMKGDSVETFKQMSEYILDVYEDENCRGILDEVYEASEDTIFLNDETTDEAMGILLKNLIEDLDDIEDEEDKLMINLIAAMYCETLGLDIEKFKEKQEDLDDNEDDLF